MCGIFISSTYTFNIENNIIPLQVYKKLYKYHIFCRDVKILLFQIAVLAAEKQRRKVQRRAIRDASNPFELPDVEFHHIYRVRKELALYLCDELNEDLGPHRADGLPVHIKVT